MTDDSSALALLEWYAAMGVNEAIAEVALDYRTLLKPSGAALPAPPVNAVSASRPNNAVPFPSPHLASPTQAVAEAKAAAAAADTLTALTDSIRAFDGCALKKAAMHTVIADGNERSGIMVIGEAPGADEDRRGIPFCGESGILLDKIFASIGLTRSQHIYITNMVFWRPPGNRNPTEEEIAICKPFVEKHIALIRPKIMLLVGGVAATELLRSPKGTGITKLRGKIHSYNCPLLNISIPTIAVLHPSYLLRQPTQKKLAWQDMLTLKKQIEQLHIA